jgi:lipopolysaccharide/colanic/teichoic acid biosynthesis glycosyltransferase
MISGAFTEIINFGQRIDDASIGEAYLLSPQKRGLDYFGARVLQAVTAPLVIAARLAVLAEDGGPTMIGLTRIGKDGVPFQQLKIRSMRPGSESVENPEAIKERDDERMTRIGQLIRPWSLDELPQFTNVVRGEMSLIAARPKSAPEFWRYCELDAGYKAAYCLIAPGQTGPEQTSGRADLSPWQRIELTKEYAAEACLKRDLDILRKTAKVLCTREGAY